MSEGIQSLESLVRFYREHGVGTIYVKHLAPNDNSKNQVYFGPGFEALTLFPMREIRADPTGKDATFKAAVDFLWIGDDLSLVTAPTAQVILYPQYPEIRFSGFLKGADRAKIQSIRELMASRLDGRVSLSTSRPIRRMPYVPPLYSIPLYRQGLYSLECWLEAPRRRRQMSVRAPLDRQLP